jgi:hypothetical protein
VFTTFAVLLMSQVAIEDSPDATDPQPAVAVGIGVLAALALATGWAAGPRLKITSTGEGAPSADYLRTLALRLGSSPRGA